jgi:GT2 family glycosyltransferase
VDLPFISVIVLNYNGLQHLEPCFSSLLALDYPVDRLELILADNASTDGSREFMQQRFPQVRMLTMPHNYGFSRANNLAAAQASGKYVAFLNNDMRVEPNWLTELVKPVLAAPDVVAAGSRILSWDGKRIDFAGSLHNFYGHGWQVGYGDEHIDDYAGDREILAPCGGAMLIDRQVFLDVGGFDEDFFAYFEDTDLGWRLWVMGYRAVLAGRSVTYHVHHGYWGQVGNERKLILYERNALYALIKNYDDENLKRVLPVALLLMLERAYFYARPAIDPAAFRMGPTVAPRPPQPQPQAQAYTAGYYVRAAWRSLWQQGPDGLWAKTQAELKRRGGLRRIRPLAHDDIEIPNLAFSVLVAGSDVSRFYPLMLEKRRKVQATRRRSDKEIVRLFHVPYQLACLEPQYAQVQQSLVTLFQLEQSFGAME